MNGGPGSLGGVPSQRQWLDLWTLESFLVERWPQQIIELGTGTGACSAYFALYCSFHGHRFHTFDSHLGEKSPHQRAHSGCIYSILQLGGNVYVQDVFSDDSIQLIQNLIDSTDETFIYCDDGDKPREIETFSPMLKVGDWIGVHDVGHEIRESELDLDGFVSWKPELFMEAGSTNRILERVAE